MAQEMVLGTFDAETAGGVMSPGFVAISSRVTAQHAIDGLRLVARDAETMAYVYVVDELERLLGVLSFHDLVYADPRAPVGATMVTDVVRVSADTSSADAASMLRDSGLLALPVVDASDRMLGLLTLDDIVDLLDAGYVEDLAHFAGTDAEAMARRSPVEVARLRTPWLLGTMAIELCAGVVISRFGHVLQQVILLASFMPVISAVSGNVGLQAAAIVVRGLDTGFVEMNRWWKSLSRELAAALLMAIVCGLTLGIIGAFWSGKPTFGVVIGGAMLCSMLTAACMGTLIPMASKRLGFDPAATAGPFETAFQDVVGFAVFLWLASLLIGYL